MKCPLRFSMKTSATSAKSKPGAVLPLAARNSQRQDFLELGVTGLLLVLLTGNIQATNRYFPDLEARSPDGRFRVEARSPDNAKSSDGAGVPRQILFQGNFVYRLFDKSQEREIWSRKQPMQSEGLSPKEGPPAAVYVSNNGWVVIRTEDLGTRCELVAVTPTGQDKLRVDILKELLPHDETFIQYVSIGSGGEHWGEDYCHSYVTPLHGKPHFCLTTWWGKRLLVDLPEGTIVKDPSVHEPKLARAEEAFVLATLKATTLWKYDLREKINPGLAEASPGPSVKQVIGAMLMASRMKLDGAVASIRELESCPIVLTTVGGRSPYEASPGGIRPGVYQNLTVRQTAQLCLRRLGVRPSAYQATKLYRADRYWHPQDPLPFQREKRITDLKPGMIPERVLKLIGAPDFIINGAWEYDLDGEDASTLVITWKAKGCGKIQKLIPPKWRNGIERDRELVL